MCITVISEIIYINNRIDFITNTSVELLTEKGKIGKNKENIKILRETVNSKIKDYYVVSHKCTYSNSDTRVLKRRSLWPYDGHAS